MEGRHLEADCTGMRYAEAWHVARVPAWLQAPEAGARTRSLRSTEVEQGLEMCDAVPQRGAMTHGAARSPWEEGVVVKRHYAGLRMAPSEARSEVETSLHSAALQRVK